MKVWVELPEENDVAAHAAAHARDAKPDRTPYGLHHLADRGDVELTFRPPLADPRLAWLARKVRNRLDSHEAVAGALSAYRRERRDADVVLCMDERTSIPAALVPGGPPIVSNIVWIGRPESYPRAARAVIGRALHRMAVIFTQGRALNAELVDGWGLDPERVVHVRLGVDPEFFPVQPWPEGEPIVASVGDDPYRDHAILIEAVRRLRESGTATTLELGTTIKEVEMPPGVGVLHRRRMEGAVRDLYRRSGAVALAARPTHRATGSTVILEAAASGRPMVATRTPSTEDLVAHHGDEGERGILVPPDDPDAFAAALREVLTEPERARAMGVAARAWLEREHTTARMADDIRAALDLGLALGASGSR